MTIVELASQINHERVRYNEALVIQGPTHPSTTSALYKFRQLRLQGKRILSSSIYN